LQLAGLPVIESCVQALPSLHSVGQLPSQVSPASITPLPHEALQSLSLPLLHPAGQQPSPPVQTVMGVLVHSAVHCDALPLSVSSVHAFPSSQLEGHDPGPDVRPGSQLSPGSSTPLPQSGPESPPLQPAKTKAVRMSRRSPDTTFLEHLTIIFSPPFFKVNGLFIHDVMM